jgi:hypothetical protein
VLKIHTKKLRFSAKKLFIIIENAEKFSKKAERIDIQ